MEYPDDKILNKINISERGSSTLAADSENEQEKL